MSEQNFFSQAVPQPWTILGLPIRPFSLGHKILLHRVGSLLVQADPESAPDYDDLAVSVFICAHSYPDAVAAFDDPALPRFMARWARLVERRSALRSMRYFAVRAFERLATIVGCRYARPDVTRRDVIDLEAKCDEFREYVLEGSQSPTIAIPEDVGTIDAPEPQLMLATLLSKTSLTYEEALDLPYGLVKFIIAAIRAFAGDVTLCDADAIHAARDTGMAIADKLRQRQCPSSA